MNFALFSFFMKQWGKITNLFYNKDVILYACIILYCVLDWRVLCRFYVNKISMVMPIDRAKTIIKIWRIIWIVEGHAYRAIKKMANL